MKRVFKRIVITSSILFIVIIITSFINHQIKLSNEKEQFIPAGQVVEVNGHQMHVYIEGDGEETLVFMSGGGTSSPFLDFKSLYTLLSDQYKVVVIEKKGYGFSEVTDSERDIDTILSETREALLQAEVEGPYILYPHSMSGIEALYWAQVYPDEVKAIIGLDMAVPAAYESYNINMPFIQLGQFIANVGLTRWIPGLSVSEAMKYGTLTNAEKELYEVIFFRRTATKNMINEVKNIKENSLLVEKGGIPDIPMLLFSSNGEGTGWDKDAWHELQKNFINRTQNGDLITLDASHYVHDIKFKKIAERSKKFIDDL